MTFDDYRMIPLAPLSSEEVPLKLPTGGGHMSITQAAFWIMTEGGNKHIADLGQPEYWVAPFDTLLRRIASEEVEAVGRSTKGGDLAERIDAVLFAGLTVSYPFAQVSLTHALGETAYLDSYCPVGGTDDGYFSDRVYAARPRGLLYSHVAVACSAIARLWPFAATDPEIKEKPVSDRDLRDWYETYRLSNPRVAAGRDAVEAAAKTHFGSGRVTRARIDSLRKSMKATYPISDKPGPR